MKYRRFNKRRKKKNNCVSLKVLTYPFGILITTLFSNMADKNEFIYFLHRKYSKSKEKRKEIATTRASVGTNSGGTCSLPQPESIFLAPLYSIHPHQNTARWTENQGRSISLSSRLRDYIVASYVGDFSLRNAAQHEAVFPDEDET